MLGSWQHNELFRWSFFLGQQTGAIFKCRDLWIHPLKPQAKVAKEKWHGCNAGKIFQKTSWFLVIQHLFGPCKSKDVRGTETKMDMVRHVWTLQTWLKKAKLKVRIATEKQLKFPLTSINYTNPQHGTPEYLGSKKKHELCLRRGYLKIPWYSSYAKIKWLPSQTSRQTHITLFLIYTIMYIPIEWLRTVKSLYNPPNPQRRCSRTARSWA